MVNDTGYDEEFNMRSILPNHLINYFDVLESNAWFSLTSPSIMAMHRWLMNQTNVCINVLIDTLMYWLMYWYIWID